MIHSAELKKIKSELKAISIKKPKKPKTLEEIKEAQEEVDSQIQDSEKGSEIQLHAQTV